MKKLTAIQASAKGEDCTFNLTGFCCNSTDTTVLCHDTRHIPNSPRKCDSRAAYGCFACHDVMDARSGLLSSADKGYEWGRAIAKTHVRLRQKGLMTFVGMEAEQSKILPRKK